MSSEVEQPIARSAKQIAMNRADEILAMPQGRFFSQDLAPQLSQEIRYFKNTAAVEIVDTERTEDGKIRNIYRVEPQARRVAQQQAETRDAVCPCGHAGVQNHGDHYECCFDLCDRKFTRDQLEVDA